MPVLGCPKCKRPFCIEPTEEALRKTLANVRILLRGKRITIKQRIRKKIGLEIPSKSLGCIFCGHKFKLRDAVRLS